MTDEEWIVYKVRRGGVRYNHGSKEDCENSMVDLLSMLLNILKKSRGEEDINTIVKKGGLNYFINELERSSSRNKSRLGLMRGFQDYIWGDIQDELSNYIWKIEQYNGDIISLVKSSDERLNSYLRDFFNE